MDECQPFIEGHLVECSSDELFKLTLAEAHRYAERYDVSMIRKALKVRSFANRRIAVQDSTLGIPKIDDPESPYHGEYPPPQFMDMQIDIMMNLIIDKHRKAVLKDLKALVFASNAVQSWYRVYLTIYILLSTIEFAYQWQLRYVKLAEGTVRYPCPRPSFEARHNTNTLCNRRIMAS